jgi:hypothetical protein
MSAASTKTIVVGFAMIALAVVDLVGGGILYAYSGNHLLFLLIPLAAALGFGGSILLGKSGL